MRVNPFSRRSNAVLSSTALAAALSLVAPAAHAVEAYGSLGLPRVLVGVAHPVNPSLTVRGDYGGVGSLSGTRTENGIRYDGDGEFNRFGLFADWYALGNGFRITGGLTFNQMSLDLEARPEGSTIMIGDNTYPVSPGDRFEARIEFPRVTPYLGIGWGHHAGEKGWSFNADLGVSFGRATVSAQAYGALASQPGVAEDIAREQAELEDGVGKIRAIPQMTIGVSYRF